MNIITSNCLGGFIYRDILKTEFQNPFIWTEFTNINDFIDFVDNFETIDFTNVMIDKNGPGLKNNFITVIDDKYRLRNRHIVFSKNDNVPIIKGTDVMYNKPWEYILEKYNKRVKRISYNDIVIALYRPETTEEELYHLIDVCKKHNYRCLIITKKNIKTDYAKIINFEHTKEPWEMQLENKHAAEIKDFLEHV